MRVGMCLGVHTNCGLVFYFGYRNPLQTFAPHSVRTNVSTEVLLNNVSIEMQNTHRTMIKRAIFDFGKVMGRSRHEWIGEHVGMVCVAAIRVWFTAKMTDVLQRMGAGNANAMRAFLNQQQNQLEDSRAIG